MLRKIFRWGAGISLGALFAYSATYSALDEYLFQKDNLSYETLRWICELMPDAGDTCYRKAYYDYHNSDYEEAAQTASQVIGREPMHVAAREVAAMAYIELRKFAQACPVMQNYAEDSPFLLEKRSAYCKS